MFRTGNATDDFRIVPRSGDEVAAAPPQATGNILTAIDSVTVTRSGIVVQVNVGDYVYLGDVIETAADGAVGVTFNDGTAFNLSTGARMVLSEFVCIPNGTSNSALFSLARGAFAFIAGKVAKTGHLTIDTPVASIRGRAEGGGNGIFSLAALAFSAGREVQAASDAASDDGAITLDNGTFEIVSHGTGQVTLADNPWVTYVVDQTGSVTQVANTDSRMVELQNAQQAALRLQAQGPTDAGQGGSSTPAFDIPLRL